MRVVGTMKTAPWLLLAALVVLMAWSGHTISGARAEAERERGRVVELTHQREMADSTAAAARRNAQRDSTALVLLRHHTDSVTATARRSAQNARRSATEAEARVRATLDSLGASTGALDSLVVAHREEVTAKDTIIATLDRELIATRSYAETLLVALDAADERTLAVAAERDSYRRQAEALARVAEPGVFARLKHEVGRAVVYGIGGYVVGKL